MIHECVKKYSRGKFILIRYYWSFEVETLSVALLNREFIENCSSEEKRNIFLFFFPVFDKTTGKHCLCMMAKDLDEF